MYKITWWNIIGENSKIGTLEELKDIIDRLDACDVFYQIYKI